MQLLFLFCTMLIIISEAFSQKLHEAPRSNSFKRTSAFIHKLIYPHSRYMFSESKSPLSVPPSTNGIAQYEARSLIPLRYYASKPHICEKRYFSREKNVNKKLKKYCLRNNCKFVTNSALKPSQCFASYSLPKSSVRQSRNYLGLPKIRKSKLHSQKKRHQCLPRAYVPFKYQNSRFKRKKLIKGLKKNHKHFSNFKRQCLSETDSSASDTNVTNVLGFNEEIETNTKNSSSFNDKLNVGSSRDFNVHKKRKSLTLIHGDDFTPVTLTTPKFEFLDYPKSYEFSLFEGENHLPNLRKNEQDSEINAESENSFEDSLTKRISKLKNTINDVENALKDRKKGMFVPTADEKNKTSKESKKTVTEKITTNATLDDSEMKQKIDSVIPLLTQISDILAKKNLTLSGNATFNSTGKTEQKKNDRCNPDGTWWSSTMAMDLTFTMQPNMMIKVALKPYKDSEINGKWSLQGLTLSKRGGPFIFAGLYPQRKKVVSFLGQCKISKEEDFIFGIWTLFSFSRKYTDLWKSVETKLDVLIKKDSNSGKKKKKKKSKKKE